MASNKVTFRITLTSDPKLPFKVMQAADSEVFKTIDVFFTLLQSPIVSEQMTVENMIQAFNCAYFVEIAIKKIQAENIKLIFEEYLRRKSERKLFPQNQNITCSDLENACDKLLERYLKDSCIPTEIIDEYLKLYSQHFGCDRLNTFLNQVISKSLATNTVIESLEELGVPLPNMEDEALIMTWQMAIANKDESEVTKCMNKMLNDGHISRLIHLTIESHDDIIGRLIIQIFSSKLIQYDSEICITFANIEKKLLLKLLQDNSFCIDFIDAIFYFGRNMYMVDGKWCSDFKFEYKHLCKIMKTLLNGPRAICELVHKRMSAVKTQPDSEIWNNIEIDILS